MENLGEVVRDLQEMRDNGYLSDAILRAAVKQLKAANNHFDWVGVYLLNAEANELWLHNYMGRGTEHAKIPVGTGVCGTAVAQASNLRVDDVSALDNYLACDPNVQSEMVVLIRAGDDIFGQFDVDSLEKGTFGETDEANVQLIADKVAEQIAQERRG